MAFRMAHFSDIHLTAPRLRLGPLDWFGKRGTGWLNHRYRRKKHFSDASTVAAGLVADVRARQYDHVVFSGDATTLGLRSEFDEVTRVMQPDGDWPPRTAVPGNHDYYTRGAIRKGQFETVFAKWQEGDRVDESIYPFVQKAGPLWVIAVNSAKSNLAVWDSRGRVGRRQLERTANLFRRLPPGPRIMVTHYPLCLADGQDETRWRRLRDARHLRELAKAAGVRLWLHGHRHVNYFRPPDKALPFAVVCAGSATQAGKWSYNEYTFVNGEMHGRRRVWSPETGTFIDGDGFSFAFPLD